MHGCVVGCCRGQPDDQLALLHLHIPHHRRPHVARGERADKARMHVATRLVHLIRAEVGVVAPDCSCVVQPSEQWRGDLQASVALHELGSEVPRTIEEEQRQGVRAECGLVDGLARRIPIDARKQAPRPDQVVIEAAHDLQGNPVPFLRPARSTGNVGLHRPQTPDLRYPAAIARATTNWIIPTTAVSTTYHAGPC